MIGALPVNEQDSIAARTAIALAAKLDDDPSAAVATTLLAICERLAGGQRAVPTGGDSPSTDPLDELAARRKADSA